MDQFALVLAIIGAINWGSIGIFGFDIVGWLFGGQMTALSRIVFTLVGLAGIWCISATPSWSSPNNNAAYQRDFQAVTASAGKHCGPCRLAKVAKRK